MKEKSWRLEDAAALAQRYKYTFFKPSAEEIALLKPGNEVKLIFSFDNPDPKGPRAERMWVKIVRIEPGGHFTGTLDNDPNYIKDLKYQDLVEFEEKHIISTNLDFEEAEENIVEKYIHRCIVSHRVLYQGEKIRFMYRQEGLGELQQGIHDTGWVFTAGSESSAYLNDPENLDMVSLGAILNRDESILPFLEAPVGSAFGWNEEHATFEPVEMDEEDEDDNDEEPTLPPGWQPLNPN